jgi:RNA polymerase sporulation-specific sigma factor
LKAFPQPLSSAEEKIYLEQFMNGDLEARNQLIERNLRLVAHIVKKYSGSARELEDLISIGTIGLIKGINTYNHQRGCRLGTYAARCIENEVLMHLRSEKKRSREVSFYEPIGTDKEGNEINLSDIIESNTRDIEESVIVSQGIAFLRKIFDTCLNQREQQIIQMRYGLLDGKEYTQREVASHIGISRSYVSRIEKSALHKLKNAFLLTRYP